MKTATIYWKMISLITVFILTGAVINTSAATFTVTNTDDSGAGSLRLCNYANHKFTCVNPARRNV